MTLMSNPVKILDNKNKCCQIKSSYDLTASYTGKIREAINKCLADDFSTIYLNVKNVNKVDLSGINEIVNSHFSLKQRSKKMVLVYKKDSDVEKWVLTTGLHRFIETAVIN